MNKTHLILRSFFRCKISLFFFFLSLSIFYFEFWYAPQHKGRYLALLVLFMLLTESFKYCIYIYQGVHIILILMFYVTLTSQLAGLYGIVYIEKHICQNNRLSIYIEKFKDKIKTTLCSI